MLPVASVILLQTVDRAFCAVLSETCDGCGEAIGAGEAYYELPDGLRVCAESDCLADWAAAYLRRSGADTAFFKTRLPRFPRFLKEVSICSIPNRSDVAAHSVRHAGSNVRVRMKNESGLISGFAKTEISPRRDFAKCSLKSE